ncbi:MAG: sigma-70 family RNA polymerase sigma factor [Ruminococcaceae bacterium]|nr:sigma-70 family RNA polymerase sigma factor [Oscillospiraceae bacterium]
MKKTEDAKIIDLLFKRDEAGLNQISNKYKNLYRTILTNLLNSKEDISECENDVLLAIWNSIPPNRPTNLSAYVCKIARNISINKFKYNARIKRSTPYVAVIDELSECIPDNSPDNRLGEKLEQEEFKNVISAFLRSLNTETRILFIRRYFCMETVSQLSERYGISENKISVKLFRARIKLHKYLEKEGIEI